LLGEGDYVAFLKTNSDLKERKPFDLYGYCVMPNHWPFGRVYKTPFFPSNIQLFENVPSEIFLDLTMGGMGWQSPLLGF
jgi:hypothetical protein